MAPLFNPERVDKLKAWCQSYIDSEKYAGILAAVNCDGTDILRESFGHFDRDLKTPVPFDAIFRIMSMTKPICAAAAMILAEEGHLNLNSPVSKFIPGFADLKVFVKKNPDGSTETEPLKTPVTIRHLMTHTSGLVYGINPADPVDALFIAERNRTQQLIGAAEKTSAEVIDDLLPVPLAFQPGSQWRYGNNFETLGRIVEIISGQDLADFCEERIFGPLGMVDTAFHCPLEKLDRMYPLYGHTLNPTTYQKDPDAPILRKPITWPFATSKPAFCSGGFGLCSTLDDYAKLCRLMVNGGELDGVRLLSPKTVEMWSVNQAPEEALPYGIPPQLGKGFSLGTYVVTDPAMLGYAQNVGSYSWSGAWSTTMWIDPKAKLYGIFLTHHEPAMYYDSDNQFQQVTYAAME